MYDTDDVSMIFHKEDEMTKDEIGQMVETAAFVDITDEAVMKARDFLCGECRDRRCKQGVTCKSFHRTVRQFAWEIVGERAELN